MVWRSSRPPGAAPVVLLFFYRSLLLLPFVQCVPSPTSMSFRHTLSSFSSSTVVSQPHILILPGCPAPPRTCPTGTGARRAGVGSSPVDRSRPPQPPQPRARATASAPADHMPASCGNRSPLSPPGGTRKGKRGPDTPLPTPFARPNVWLSDAGDGAAAHPCGGYSPRPTPKSARRCPSRGGRPASGNRGWAMDERHPRGSRAPSSPSPPPHPAGHQPHAPQHMHALLLATSPSETSTQRSHQQERRAEKEGRKTTGRR